ncbi:MAG TPA: tripartite tricarboxylate transporter TctB family protein [Geminicoccus sp.]|jgi:hypothetical protein|uniref:tripartite tricarboxylate transporter TctB family protein n=1 Tax=Geminicoccus sp. TaxID=2024832 RepID=UPI002E32EEEC|nr:tripartite tricarboxylate transporter TctB family protein [Geminicoccus sp.]HEX2526148.1 tripartite tricarboxylate transporter TctB family protein [Geminicoccus sp.]
MGTRSSRDIAAGLLFLVVALAFLWFAQNHAFGRPNRMGPAFFPSVLAILLGIMGTAILVRGLRAEGQAIGPWPWRAMLLVLGAGVLFGLTIRSFGLIATVPAVVLVSSFASRQARPTTSLILALVLGLFSILVFAYGLGLPIPVFGRWLGG